MSEQGIPEAWVGNRVEVMYNHGNVDSLVQGTLKEVGDRGIVLDEDGTIRFYPWPAVAKMQEYEERRGLQMGRA